MSPADTPVCVRRLKPTDARSAFRSGDIDLDRFFHRYAGQNQFRHHVGTSWVAVVDERIVGFATVSAGHFELGGVPDEVRRGLPAYPLPVLRLARLAVASEHKGRGVGRLLLKAVFAVAWRLTEDGGCVGVVVDAKPGAVDYYARLGFRALRHTRGGLGERPMPTPMFLELAAIPPPPG